MGRAGERHRHDRAAAGAAPAAVRARIRREYDRLAARYRDADGQLALPTAALLASARVA